MVVAAGVVAPHGGRAVDLGRVRADLAERGGRPDGRTVRPRPAAAGAEHGRRLRSVGRVPSGRVQGWQPRHVVHGRHDGQRASAVVVHGHVHRVGQVLARHVRHDVAGHAAVRAGHERMVPVGRRRRAGPRAGDRRVLRVAVLPGRPGTAAGRVRGCHVLTAAGGRAALTRGGRAPVNRHAFTFAPVRESETGISDQPHFFVF